MNQKAEMDFMGHLAELRTRLIIAATAILLGSILAYYFSGDTVRFLSAPFHDQFKDQLLIGTGPAEAFMLKLKVALFSGILLASPVIFHQLWIFVSPALEETEKRWVLPFIFVTTALFLCGVAFCYWVVFPFAFQFFQEQYASIGITPTIRISEHMAMVIQGLLAFGLIFEFPVLAFILGKLGIIDHTTLIKYARHAVVLIFIVSAVLTPPDVITQILMAIPLLGLYGISIYLVKLTCKPANPADAP